MVLDINYKFSTSELQLKCVILVLDGNQIDFL